MEENTPIVEKKDFRQESKKEPTAAQTATSETKKEPSLRTESYIGPQAIKLASANSKLGAISAVLSALLCISAIFLHTWSNASNSVVAVPGASLWEYPMVHWVNTPDRYTEQAKPIFVAQKYISGLYEIDPLDFEEVDGAEGSKVYLSNSIAELLAYTVRGTQEYVKVQTALERSFNLYKLYAECKCVKRFLISDILISQPPIPQIRIELIGRFVIFGTDGQQPLPIEDLGYKSIVLSMAHDIPIFNRQSSVADATGGVTPGGVTSEKEGEKTKVQEEENTFHAENPEGWYVMRSQISTIDPADIHELRKMRKEAGMKEAK
jgi:hypothetical protein